MNKNNASMSYPSGYLAINETLYSYCGRIGIKQYNPSKLAKYRLLYKRLCNSTISYIFFNLPYASKPNNTWSSEASKFYVSGTDEYLKYFVTETCKYKNLTKTNISMDRYFTSVGVAKWALDEQSITIAGTMRHDRKEIPRQLKMLDRRKVSTINNICLFRWWFNNTLSYVDKKNKKKKHCATDNDA